MNGHTNGDVNGDGVNPNDSRVVAVKSALAKLASVAGSSSQWKELLTHDGLSVRASPAEGKEATVYCATTSLSDCTPQRALETIGRPELWDEWKPQTKIVEEIGHHYAHVNVTFDANGQTRVSSLVEGVQHFEDGRIHFAATSHAADPGKPLKETEKKGKMVLSGWTIIPKDGGVEVSHFLQLEPRSFLPRTASKKVIPRHTAANVAAFQNIIKPSYATSTTSTSRKEGRRSIIKLVTMSASQRSEHNKQRSRSGTGGSMYGGPPSALPSRASSIFLPMDQNEQTEEPEAVEEDAASNVSSELGGVSVVSEAPPSMSPAKRMSTQPNKKPNGIVAITEDAEPAQATSKHSQPRSDAALSKKALFDRLLKESPGWKVAEDQFGHRVWTLFGQDSPLPIIKSECNTAAKVPTENLIGALLDPAYRSSWNPRFVEETYVSANTSDGVAVWKETLAGLYPHIPDHKLEVTRAIFRSRQKGGNPIITVLEWSTKTKDDGELAMNGWQIAKQKNGSHTIRNIHHYVPSQKRFPAFVGKIYAVLNAQGMAKLASLISQSPPPTYNHPGDSADNGPTPTEGTVAEEEEEEQDNELLPVAAGVAAGAGIAGAAIGHEKSAEKSGQGLDAPTARTADWVNSNQNIAGANTQLATKPGTQGPVDWQNVIAAMLTPPQLYVLIGISIAMFLMGRGSR